MATGGGEVLSVRLFALDWLLIHRHTYVSESTSFVSDLLIYIYGVFYFLKDLQSEEQYDEPRN